MCDFAKVVYPSKGTEGSNPSVSARTEKTAFGLSFLFLREGEDP